MKIRNSLMILVLTVVSCSTPSGEGDNQKQCYTGPYLGQKDPGLSPALFAPGFIATGLDEGSCSFSPDGREVYFHIVYEKDHKLRVALAGSKEINGRWTEPEILEFSGKAYFDGYPFLDYEGKTLYFSSDRPVPGNGPKNNIWYCKRIEGGWTEPEVLNLPCAGKDGVSGISISLNGRYYYTIMEEDGQFIYRTELSDGKFEDAVKLPEEVNSVKSQFDGMIAPDESYMILCVYGREDSFGSTDLYISFRDKNDNWTELVNMGSEFNTPGVDGPACISADGKYIFFSAYLRSGNWFNRNNTYRDILLRYSSPGYGSSDPYWINADIAGKYMPLGYK